MGKKMVYGILLVCSFVLAVISAIKLFGYEGAKKGDTDINNEGLAVQESKKPVKSCDYLLEESEIQSSKDKVLNYLDGEGVYRTQAEVTVGDKIYKSVQICTIEHYDYECPFVLYYNDDVRMQTAFEKMLTDENLMTGEEHDKEFEEMECYENFVKSSYVKSVVQHRGENFDFANELATTALLICDLDGNIQEVKALEGAFGLDITQKGEQVCWRVYVITKMDNLLYGLPTAYREKRVFGINYSFGDVCDIMLDAGDNIISAEFIRYSEENPGYEMVYATYRNLNKKIYVKNNEISIRDVIDNYWKILDDTQEIIDLEYQSVFNDGVKDVLGQPHYNIYGINKMYDVYETVEGYVVAVDDYNKNIYFNKMSHEEFIKNKQDAECPWVEKAQNAIYNDGKLNPELEEYTD